MSEDSRLLYHAACDSCGSSDANAVYDDGHQFCFSCDRYLHGDGAETPSRGRRVAKELDLIPGEIPYGVPSRGLTEETCRKWNYRVSRELACQIAEFRSMTGEVVAQKLRFKDKDFSVRGKLKGAALYGAHLWGGGGKKVIVTEGEIDAMSVSQIQNHKWPVVSILNGAARAPKDLLENLDWLSKYDEVILMMDNDEKGRLATQTSAEALSPYVKVKVAELPLKDANDMLMAGREKELVDAMWKAREYMPDGLVAASECFEEWIKAPPVSAIGYPWEGLNGPTKGLRRGEIVTLTAGTGVGKSALAREVVYDLIQQNERVGMIMLEENERRTLDGLVGLHIGRRVSVSREGIETDELRRAFRELFSDNEDECRVFLDKAWGSENWDRLISKIRHLAVSKGCRWIVLDHISIAVSGLDIVDERKAIDIAMTQLRTLVEKTNIGLIVVSHLKRPDGNKGFEEGLEVTLSHLRGSQAIAQLSDMVIALQRNKRDPERRLWTQVVVLKNRFTGEDGCTACWLNWDNETGRLVEAKPDWFEGFPNEEAPDELDF